MKQSPASISKIYFNRMQRTREIEFRSLLSYKIYFIPNYNKKKDFIIKILYKFN